MDMIRNGLIPRRYPAWAAIALGWGLCLYPFALWAGEPSLKPDLAKLAQWDWGQDAQLLADLEKAVAQAHGQPGVREGIEKGFLEILASKAPRAAKDFSCRMLGRIGSSQAAGVLAGFLGDPDLAPMARFALERIGAPAASKALREALPSLQGPFKAGAALTLGALSDPEALPLLLPLLGDSSAEVAGAAAVALGRLGTVGAAQGLLQHQTTAPEPLRPLLARAAIEAAYRLLAGGQPAEAQALFKALSAPAQNKAVRVAAAKGLLDLSAQPKGKP